MYKDYRDFLKDSIRKEIDFSQTAQSRGEAPLLSQKPYPAIANKIALAKPGNWQAIPALNLETAIIRRRSRRSYTTRVITTRETLGTPNLILK